MIAVRNTDSDGGILGCINTGVPGRAFAAAGLNTDGARKYENISNQRRACLSKKDASEVDMWI